MAARSSIARSPSDSDQDEPDLPTAPPLAEQASTKVTNDSAVYAPREAAAADPSAALSRTSRPPDPLIGSLVADRYRIEERLGEGGMGAVYRAVHVHMRNTVALKVLHQQMSYVPEAVARFEREAVAAARIEHPNVAKATDFGRLADGSFYMALEFVQGVSLRHLLNQVGALPVPRAVNIVRQIAEALGAAHRHGVVHRDLKPENVMLIDKGSDLVKVLDFGIAKVSNGNSDSRQLTQLGSVFGTPDYMSPEQAAGQPVDPRSDLYALGVLLYELLTGDPPFSGPSIAIVLTKHMHEAPPPLPQSIDWRLGDLALRLLAKNPADRPQSARAVAQQLIELRLSLVPARPKQGLAKLLAQVYTPLCQAGLRLNALVMRGTRHWITPGATRTWDWAKRRLPALGHLERELSVGKLRIKLGALAAVLLGFTVASLWLGGSHPVSVSAAAAPGSLDNVELFDEPGAEAEPAAPPQASPIPPELEALLATPVYKRKTGDWLEIARGHRERGDFTESTAAYRNAIQLDKALATDGVVLQGLRHAAEQRKSYEAAINVAVTLLGEPGLDLVYDLWVTTRDERKSRTIAEFAYKKLEILRLRRASKALRVRLDLEFTPRSDCVAIQRVVSAAIQHADQRSVPALEALQATSGCGPQGQDDCTPCLGDRGDVDAALQTAREQPGPRFDGARFLPAP